jgi:hypothetical protein
MKSKVIEHTTVQTLHGRQHHKVLMEIDLDENERIENLAVRAPSDRTCAPMKWYEDPKFAESLEGSDALDVEGSEKNNLSVTSWHLNMNRMEKPATLTDEKYDHIHVVAHLRRKGVEIVQEGVGLLVTPHSEGMPWEKWTPDRITIRISTSKWVGK